MTAVMDPPTGSDAPRVLRQLYPWIAVLAIAILLWLARDMTFRGDDWDLVARRSLLDPIGLMRPFNEQWVLVPAVIFRLIFTVIGMHSYLPYLLVLLLCHVAVAEAVRRLVVHSAGSFAGYLAGLLVLLLGTGAENLRWAFQIGMVLSTATGLWAVYYSTARLKPRAAAFLLLLSVSSHAIGVVFLVATILTLAVAHQWKSLAWLAIPSAALLSWLVLFGLPAMAARGTSLIDGVGAVPVFVVAGIATATGSLTATHTAGGIIILAACAALVALLGIRPARPTIVLAVVTALVVEYGLIAVSRAEFGLGSVGWSRYTYVGASLALIGLAGWFGASFRPWRDLRPSMRLAMGLTVAVAILLNLRYYVDTRDAELVHIHRSRATAAVAAWAHDAVRPPSDVHVPPPEELRSLFARHGSPARDDLLPGVVPEVPLEIARGICSEMLPGTRQVSACLAAVADGVGEPRTPAR